MPPKKAPRTKATVINALGAATKNVYARSFKLIEKRKNTKNALDNVIKKCAEDRCSLENLKERLKRNRLPYSFNNIKHELNLVNWNKLDENKNKSNQVKKLAFIRRYYYANMNNNGNHGTPVTPGNSNKKNNNVFVNVRNNKAPVTIGNSNKKNNNVFVNARNNKAPVTPGNSNKNLVNSKIAIQINEIVSNKKNMTNAAVMSKATNYVRLLMNALAVLYLNQIGQLPVSKVKEAWTWILRKVVGTSGYFYVTEGPEILQRIGPLITASTSHGVASKEFWKRMTQELKGVGEQYKLSNFTVSSGRIVIPILTFLIKRFITKKKLHDIIMKIVDDEGVTNNLIRYLDIYTLTFHDIHQLIQHGRTPSANALIPYCIGAGCAIARRVLGKRKRNNNSVAK